MTIDTDATVVAEPPSVVPPRALAAPLPPARLVVGRGRRLHAPPFFPWALVAADALLLHLLTLPATIGAGGLLAGAAFLTPLNWAWARSRRRSREAASALALPPWGVACALGGVGLLLARSRVYAPDPFVVAAFAASVYAAVALLETGFPHRVTSRVFWVTLALGAALTAHLVLTLLPARGGPSGG